MTADQTQTDASETESARPRETPAGFVNVDKPTGMTSFDVVRRVRHAARTKKVGHTGTLDPLATGVLPIALGEATKLVDELMDARKRYRGVITLGVATDTFDSDGDVVAESDASAVTAAEIERALGAFEGELMQTPPAFSAVKRNGVPAYKAARAGKPHQLDPRPVTVYSLSLVSVEATHVTVDVECGKGFYMRALASELGATLGVGGHLSALRRTAVGRFNEGASVPLAEVEERLAECDTETLVHAPDSVILDWPAVILNRESVGAARNGGDVRPSLVDLVRAGDPGERARGYGPDGALVALLESGAIPGSWHPYRVFPASKAKI
ncbi:MAG TPA: tRNA pseudouridine(55) synthase TruB [Dehalococcoidia bacterium]|nr:tRNA pseudouridine(55) synthase TruB [Dehalococcoidia bacterium]